MDDPRRHVIVDTNLLIYYLHPQSADTKTVRERSKTLFDAALKANWSSIRLYVPAISVAEAMGVLDKYRYCTWAGPVHQDPSKRLSSKQYKRAKHTLNKAIQSRRLEQIDHEPSHVSLASLISPVNQKYQFRRHRGSSSKVKKPMGGADCLIGGMAVLMQRRMGGEHVVLATADQRLRDVMTKCQGLSERQAEQLGIKTTAEAVGIPWSEKAFPATVNIRDARVAELRETFFGWPLPTKPCQSKTRDDLAEADEEALVAAWKRIARRHGITNADSLPHSPAINELRTEFAATGAVEMSNRGLFLALIGMRKAGRLPRVR